MAGYGDQTRNDLRESPVPESKRRKKNAYTPEQKMGERKVARFGSPAWLAPTMVAAFVIGLAYLVVFYIAGNSVPVMNSIGGDLNALVNVGIGFAFIMVGFGLATRWK
jgi:hypothetical protein